jgi:hypothetical protein
VNFYKDDDYVSVAIMRMAIMSTRDCEGVKMENEMTINKIPPLKLGYFHQEDQDHFLSR